MSAVAADLSDSWICAGYAAQSDRLDEMIGADGTIRPVWKAVLQRFDRLGREELAALDERARRLIRENGITCIAYDEADGPSRPWPYDVMPLVLGHAEWSSVERGLAQRARLLDALLDDLYGAQESLRARLLPPALVYANPEYLRPCRKVPVPGGVRLHLFGADLVRLKDGAWHVAADHTQAPAGAGYALENRIITARTHGESLREVRVRRLADFFRGLRDALLRLTDAAEPRIVLLTEGPHDGAFFEHAYLARYLGCTLVEGGDLTVRDQRVFIKSLDGLKPVHVILRRVGSSLVDPLDFRVDSQVGLPGLMQAVRAGRVVIVNAIGSGLVDTAAFSPYLPALCRHLLGEELELPSLSTRWCGDEEQRRDVLARLGEFVLKPAFSTRHEPSDLRGVIDPRRLTVEKLRILRDRLQSEGFRFAAQERAAFSTTPVLLGDRLEPRPVCLRAFAAFSGQGWTVMPGGLARVAGADAEWPPSLQEGEASKDSWVLAERPVSFVSLMQSPEHQRYQIRRSSADLPSRAADNLFWLGRYAERADTTVRLLRSVLLRLTENKGLDIGPAPVLQAFANLAPDLAPGDDPPLEAIQLENVLTRLCTDAGLVGSLPHTLDALDRAATSVRERLSSDAWRTLRQLGAAGRTAGAEKGSDGERTAALLQELIRDLAAFSGMAQENMTRGVGWHMLEIGRRIERVFAGVGLLGSLVASPDPEADGTLEWLLELADSFMTYRMRYLAAPLLGRTLDLLLLDESNPRAVAFQIHVLIEHVNALPHVTGLVGKPRERRLSHAARNALIGADLRRLGAADSNGRRVELECLLTTLERLMNDLSETITRHYFRHLPPPHATIGRTFGAAVAL